MNQPNLYSYSILSGVWNDLAMDVLLLVKEYLRIHLNRRILNKDYNVFLDKASQEMSLVDIPNWHAMNSLKVRYGLKNWNNYSYLDKNGNNILLSLDYIKSLDNRYCILGIRISLDTNGCNHYARRAFVEDFTDKYFPNVIEEYLVELIEDEQSLKSYVRLLIKAEENGYTPWIQP